jgi:hypothetical protein
MKIIDFTNVTQRSKKNLFVVVAGSATIEEPAVEMRGCCSRAERMLMRETSQVIENWLR